MSAARIVARQSTTSLSAKAEATKRRILEAANAEFLCKGFLGASLRTIAKAAGVTTGALYGYFSDKDDLFAALTREHAEYFTDRFIAAHDAFSRMGPREQIDNMTRYTDRELHRLIEYVFDHIDTFRLLIRSSTGSSFEDWLDGIIRIEEEHTIRFMESIREQGFPTRNIPGELVHTLCESYFRNLMETAIRTDSKAEALRQIALLRDFSNAGWNVLLGVTPSAHA